MRVSVVMIARATSSKGSGDKRRDEFRNGIGDQLRIQFHADDSRRRGQNVFGLDLERFRNGFTGHNATRSPVRVAQFALPAFTRTAVTLPLEDFKCLRASRTGLLAPRFG